MQTSLPKAGCLQTFKLVFFANNGIKLNDLLKKNLKSNACEEDAESADFAYPLKFVFSEKATKFEKIFIVLLTRL